MKVKDCIKRLGDTGIVYKLVPIDDYVTKVSGREFVEVLGMPPRIQESLWSEAFEAVRRNLPQEGQNEGYVFLTFHACYFHQRKTEFVCPADLGQLVQLKDRTRMVVVFLDDCYDIYRRLMGTGEMYSHVLRLDPLEASLQSILNLLCILTWREIEIAFSRKIAQLLSVPLYAVAVKHPSFMVSRLIAGGPGTLRILYLSHPISAIRRRATYPRLPEFYADLSTFIKDALRCENVVLFVPDTIDEYRIEQDEGNKYIPKVLDGWPLPYSDSWLFKRLPQRLERLNPLNPRNFNFQGASSGTQSAVALILRVLSEKIREQINSRDRSLVEQSREGIVVFRPYWAGSTPSGVEQEMIYNRDLRNEYGEGQREAYILSTCEELGKRRVKQLFTLVENGAIISADDKARLQGLCESWLADPSRVRQFCDKTYESEDVRRTIEGELPEDYEFSQEVVGVSQTALATGDMLGKAERQDRIWEGIRSQVEEDDPLGRYGTAGCSLICERSNFGQESERFIQSVIACGPVKGEETKGG